MTITEEKSAEQLKAERRRIETKIQNHRALQQRLGNEIRQLQQRVAEIEAELVERRGY